MTVSVKKAFSSSGPKTAGDYLFDKFFHVEMETFSTVSEEQLEVRGEFTSGDPNIDRQMSKRHTKVWRNIDQLLDLWHDGVEISMIGGMTDVNRIHEIIQEHLNDCAKYHSRLQSSFRRERSEVTAERLRDLKSLDEFGRYLYNKARLHTKEAALSGIDKILAETGDIVGSNIPSTDQRAVRNSPDYVGIEERIDYGALSKRKRHR